MAKKSPKGEMPFLDHLEELRWRIFWSAIALVLASIVGFFVVQRFDVVSLLMIPIRPHLRGETLAFIRPTDAFLITIKLSVTVGAVLASPVIFAQVWGFLSPALYEKERRTAVPAMIAGVGLFLAGAWMAYLWILPAVLRLMLSDRFLGDALEPLITASEYFGFATQIIIAFGVVFELPLVMVLLAALRLVSPYFFARHRPYAVLLGAVVAALVTPPDIFSMMMMMVPIVVLYEIGILVGRFIWKRATPKANAIGGAAILVLALTGAPEAAAQERPPPARPDTIRTPTDSLRSDSLAQDSLAGRAIDTTLAATLGLPTGPSRQFPGPDSVITALLARAGYTVTRYAADSLTYFAQQQRIDMAGAALVERETGTLEADTVRFLQAECALQAGGDPKMFESGTVLVGNRMTYDTCERRGVVNEARTSFNQSGVDWFLNGQLGIDSASTRIYAGGSDVTSCDLDLPHYHFETGKVKWVTNNLMVARPAVLYVRDVPIMWLPFIFQDMRRGRRSGLLTPRFGINDIVRPNEGYRRHVTNIGYYFAINDYVDAQASLDWFSGTSVTLNGEVRYSWLDRFINGRLGLSRILESGVDGAPGSRSIRLNWNHNQQFDRRTRFVASVDFASSSRAIRDNSINPFLQTANLRSSLNFTKQFDWGTIAAGGNRVQDLSSEQVTQTFPDVRLTPVPIDIARDVTWSPSFSLNTQRTFNQPSGVIDLPPLGGFPQQDSLFSDRRTTRLQLGTPLRLGRWNWQNSFQMSDVLNEQRSVETFQDPSDTTQTLTRVYAEDFSTEIDWNTGIGLPMLFGSTWKLQPSVGIQNSTSGPFMIRNRFTNGQFVQQGKRLSFSAGSSPSVFGFFPGVGPIGRIRHSFSPQFRWSYAPPADISAEYARARNPGLVDPVLRSDAVHTVGLAGISQTFEGKYRPPPDDTTGGQNAQKIKLLSLQTSGVEYDIEQAKQPGRNGWRTSSVTNSFTSDLLRGFSLRTTHDLWDGPVGFDTTRLDPFLSSVSAQFSLSGETIGRIARALFGGETWEPPQPGEQAAADSVDYLDPAGVGQPLGRGTSFPTVENFAGGGLGGPRRGQGFQASVRYNDRRTRMVADADPESPTVNRNMGLTVSFSPTANWSLSWTTDYNFTTKEFGSHSLRFDRDLHRWRATFAFVQAPNGNFAFNFFVNLLDQPEIKFQYDQQTLNR